MYLFDSEFSNQFNKDRKNIKSSKPSSKKIFKRVCEHLFSVIFVTIMVGGVVLLTYKYVWPFFESEFEKNKSIFDDNGFFE
jgi:hypothetical protein